MNAHTLSRELVASLRPTLPTERLPVPEMVERLKVARAKWNDLADAPEPISRAESERIGDDMSELDARKDVLTTAIIAAVDAALQDIGLTFAALSELNL